MPKRRFADEEEVEISKLYLIGGCSVRAIGRAYGLPGKDSVLGALRRQNITQRSPSERNRIYKVDAHAFDVITPEAAYWWGFLYADGYISRLKSLVVVLQRRDSGHLCKLKNFLKSEHPIYDFMSSAQPNGIKYPQSGLCVTERQLVSALANLGIVTGRTNPGAITEFLPKEMCGHFIRGLFDGDGSIDVVKSGRQPRFRICGDSALVNVVAVILSGNGISIPVCKKHTTKNVYYLTKSGRIEVSKIIRFIYRDATVFLERKREIADEVLSMCPLERVRDTKGRWL